MPQSVRPSSLSVPRSAVAAAPRQKGTLHVVTSWDAGGHWLASGQGGVARPGADPVCWQRRGWPLAARGTPTLAHGDPPRSRAEPGPPPRPRPRQDAYVADSLAAFVTNQADDGMEDEMTFSERSRFVRSKGGTWLYANGEVTTDTPGLAGAILNK